MKTVDQINNLLPSLTREELMVIAQKALNMAMESGEDALSQEEIAEFNRRFEALKSGKDKGVSLEEFRKRYIHNKAS